MQEPVKVAEASRPGTGMYGGNLELVSRRENVQVLPALDKNLDKQTCFSLPGECTEGVLRRKWRRRPADAEVQPANTKRFDLLLNLQGCSDGGTMGCAGCGYRLCHHLLDHGHLQVHLWLVDLQIILHCGQSFGKELFTIFKMNHVALNWTSSGEK